MVSNAREDLPEPLRPVMTVILSLGITTSTFFRLCCLAPLTTILLSLSYIATLDCMNIYKSLDDERPLGPIESIGKSSEKSG